LMGSRGIDQAAVASLAWAAVAMGCWGIVSLLAWGHRRAHLGVVSTLTGVWLLYSLVGYPLLNSASSASGLMHAVGQRIGPDAELGLVAWKEQNLLMADRPAATFGFQKDWDAQLRDGVAWQAQAPARRWLLVQQDALLPCVDRSRAELAGISNRRRWWLVPAAAVHGACELPADARERERALQARQFEE